MMPAQRVMCPFCRRSVSVTATRRLRFHYADAKTRVLPCEGSRSQLHVDPYSGQLTIDDWR